MDLSIPDEYTMLAETARRLMSTPDGTRARFGRGRATAADRRALLGRLEEFGLFDLDVRSDPADALAAGLVLREAGAASVAVPAVAMASARAAGLDGLVHAIGRETEGLMLNHVDLGYRSHALDLEGRLYRVHPLEEPAADRRWLVPYASRVRLEATDRVADPRAWAVSCVLGAYWAAGTVDSAFELARSHVTTRMQFGKPLSSFQGVRNRTAEIVVRRQSLQELCHYTAWRISAEPSAAVVDALMLRYHQLVAVREVLTAVHQLHGALGFCFEYALIQRTLGSQFDRQIPLSEAACLTELVDRYAEIETHYQTLEPAWPLVRADRIPSSQVIA